MIRTTDRRACQEGVRELTEARGAVKLSGTKPPIGALLRSRRTIRTWTSGDQDQCAGRRIGSASARRDAAEARTKGTLLGDAITNPGFIERVSDDIVSVNPVRTEPLACCSIESLRRLLLAEID